MANNSDGAIIIDSKIDNTGFTKGSKKMEAAANGVTSKISKIGEQAGEAVKAAAPAMRQMAQEMGGVAQETETLGSEMAEAMSSVAFEKEVAATERAFSSLEAQFQKLSDRARMGLKTDSQMQKFALDAEKVGARVEALRQRIAALHGQKVITSDFEQLAMDAEKAEQALFRLYSRRDEAQALGVAETSREWQRLAVQIQNAESVLKRYEADMLRLHASGTAMTTGAQTSQYQQMAASLRGMIGNMQQYMQVAAGFDNVSEPAANSRAALENLDKELQQKPGDAQKASSALGGFGSMMKSLAGTALRTAGALAKTSFSALARGAKKAASGIANLARQNRNGALSSQGLVKALTSMRRMLLTRLKGTFLTAIMQNVKVAVGELAKHSSQFNKSMSSMQNAAKQMGGNLAVSFGGLVNAIAPAISSIINWVSQAISYLNSFFALLSGKSTVTVAKKQTDDYAKSLGGAAGAAKELKEQVFGFDELNKQSSDSSGGGGGGGGTGNLFEDVPIDSLLPDSVASFFSALKTAFEAGDWEGIGGIIAGGLNMALQSVDDWITSIQPVAMEWTSNIARVLNGLVSGFDWTQLGKTIANGLNTAFGVFNTFLTTFNFAALGVGLGNGLNGLIHNIKWGQVASTFANKWNALIKFIRGLVQTIDWVGLGSGIATAVNTWFSTIDWAEAGRTVNDGIKGVFKGLHTYFQETDWEQVGESIKTFLKNINWEGIAWYLGGLFGDMVRAAIELFFGEEAAEKIISQKQIDMFFQRGDVSFASVGLSDETQEFLDNFELDQLTLEAGGVVITGNVVAKEKISEYFKELEQVIESGAMSGSAKMAVAAATIVSGYGDGLAAAEPELFAAASKISDALQGATTNDELIVAFSQLGYTVTDNLATAINTGEVRVADALNALAIGMDSEMIASMGKAELDGWIQDFYERIGTEAGDALGEAAVSSADAGVMSGLSALESKSGELVDSLNIKNEKADLEKDNEATAKAGMTAVQTGISGGVSNVESEAKSAVEAVKAPFEGLPEETKAQAELMMLAIETAIDAGEPSATSAVKAASDAVVKQAADIMSGDAGKTIGKDFIDGVRDGGNAQQGMLLEVFRTVAASGKETLSDTLSKSAGTTIGEQIGDGLVDGINNRSDAITSTARSVALAALRASKKALGISSPSKEYEKVGVFSMEGWQGGLEDGEGAVLRTIANIADATVAAAEPSFGLEADAMVTGLDQVAGKLTGIAAVFASIADAIASMGGLRIPAIAMGTVAPYKTRIPSGEDPAGMAAPLAAFSNNFDETMSNQSDLLRELIDVVRRLRLLVDGESLTQAITSFQRSHERSFGGA